MSEKVKKINGSGKRKTPKKDVDEYQLALDLYLERGGITLEDEPIEWY
jgi:Holliday junction resolvase RusA-like endonuclease